MVKMNKVVAGLKPDVIFWGGDYSYSDGKPAMVQREIDWHANVHEHLIG